MKKILLLIIMFALSISLSGCIRKNDEDIVDVPVVLTPEIIFEETEEMVIEDMSFKYETPDYLLEIYELHYTEQLKYWNANALWITQGIQFEYEIIDEEMIITHEDDPIDYSQIFDTNNNGE